LPKIQTQVTNPLVNPTLETQTQGVTHPLVTPSPATQTQVTPTLEDLNAGHKEDSHDDACNAGERLPLLVECLKSKTKFTLHASEKGAAAILVHKDSSVK